MHKTMPWGIVGVIALCCSSGCGGVPATATGEPIVFVCGESQEVFLLPPQPTPAKHPQTGKATLYRGVYCPQCDRWYPSPPTAGQAGNPRPVKCRTHNIEMTFSGPPPKQDR